ncbi:MAG TPA: universal stress protein [Planctomycetaceae bacterium]|nr:universal stress protein [Planctomycetaceae bacterium]
MRDIPTNQIKKICFVRTGGSGDTGAFERALRLCKRTQAELSIVSVSEPPPEGVLSLLKSWGASAESVLGEQELSNELEALVKSAKLQGVEAAFELLRGSAFLEIIRKVMRDEYNLLIKAAQPTRVIHQVLFGHLDRQLIRKCPCPVWIEKPSNRKRHDTILAAVDPTPFLDHPDYDPLREELNTSILQFSLLLAQTEDAAFHVVHVWPFDLEMSLQTRTGLSDEVIAQVAASIRKKHETALKRLVAPFLGHITQMHVLKGTAGAEIARLAQTENADLIVMGTICRGGIEGLLIGNTAETVLDQVDCSVVALKPRGFVSPVQA